MVDGRADHGGVDGIAGEIGASTDSEKHTSLCADLGLGRRGGQEGRCGHGCCGQDGYGHFLFHRPDYRRLAAEPLTATRVSSRLQFERLGHTDPHSVEFRLGFCPSLVDLASDRNHHLQVALEFGFGAAGTDDYPGVFEGEAQAVRGW